MEAVVDRLRSRLEALSEIGACPSGGVTRLAYSPQERAAHALFAAWVTELGGRVETDAAGSSIGILREGAPYLLVGSHLDSVIDGGNYDGPAGVVTGLAVAEALAAEEDGPPLRVVAFAAEEGARFGGPCLGSRAAAGVVEDGWADAATDAHGTTVAEAAAAVGLDPSACEPWVASGDVLAYLEVHIEQGRVLEERRLALGSVDAVAGSIRMMCEVDGLAEHSGATPMNLRHDALAGAAEMVLAVERLASGSRTLRATVGRLEVVGGGVTTVPGSVQFSCDVRDTDARRQSEAAAQIRTTIAEVAARRGLTARAETLSSVDPVLLSSWPRLALQQAATERGIGFCVMPSGAGHDAAVVARVAPASLVFVPCDGGRSHVASELCRVEDLAVASAVVADGIRIMHRQTRTLSAQDEGTACSF